MLNLDSTSIKMAATKSARILKHNMYGFKNQSFLYDRFRPQYPDKLVNYVIDYVTSKEKPINTSADRGRMNSCALDIACGTGLFTRKLAPFFKMVYGIDWCEQQLEMVKLKDTANQSFARLCNFLASTRLPNKLSQITLLRTIKKCSHNFYFFICFFPSFYFTVF